MSRYFKFGVIVGLVLLSVFWGYKQMLHAEERNKDFAFLNYIPLVSLGEHRLELYEFGQCKEESIQEENVTEGPSSCDSVTMEEALQGKTADSFDKELVLMTRNIQSSGELENKDGPTNGVRRVVSGGYSKDGVSLGPPDVKFTYKNLQDEYIETIMLPKEPGYYVGKITLGTPSGNKNYVYHFYYK